MGQGILFSRGSRFGGVGSGELKTTIITTTQEWTVPRAMGNNFYVRIFGGGGGLHKGTSLFGSAGAGSGYMANGIFSLTAGTRITISIGAAGANDQNGGTTSFGPYISALGGEIPMPLGYNQGGNGGAGGGGIGNSKESYGYGGNAQYGGGGGGLFSGKGGYLGGDGGTEKTPARDGININAKTATDRDPIDSACGIYGHGSVATQHRNGTKWLDGSNMSGGGGYGGNGGEGGWITGFGGDYIIGGGGGGYGGNGGYAWIVGSDLFQGGGGGGYGPSGYGQGAGGNITRNGAQFLAKSGVCIIAWYE